MIPPLVFDLLGLVALIYTLTTRVVPVRLFLLALAASALAFWAHLRVHELWAGRVLHLSPQEARALPIFEPLLAAQTVATVLADRRRFADGAWVLHLGELAAVRAMSLSRFCKGALSTTQGAEADWARAAAMCALLHVALLTLARLVGAVDEPATTKAAASGPPPARAWVVALAALPLSLALFEVATYALIEQEGGMRILLSGMRFGDPTAVVAKLRDTALLAFAATALGGRFSLQRPYRPVGAFPVQWYDVDALVPFVSITVLAAAMLQAAHGSSRGKAIAAALFGGAVVQPVVTHVALRTVDMWLNDALGDEAFEDESEAEGKAAPKARRRAKPKAE